MQENLPEYLGLAIKQEEEEEADYEEEESAEPEPEPEGEEGAPAAEEEEALPADGVAVTYKVIRKAAVRASFELDSEQIAILETGDTVEVFEHKKNENGQIRVKTGPIYDGDAGWTSITSRDGNKLMVEHRVGEGEAEDKVEVRDRTHLSPPAVSARK